MVQFRICRACGCLVSMAMLRQHLMQLHTESSDSDDWLAMFDTHVVRLEIVT